MAGSLSDQNAELLRSLEKDGGLGGTLEEGKPKQRKRDRTLQRSISLKLDELEDEARAGASDAYLARAAGTSVENVRSWRKTKKIRRSSKKEEIISTLAALDLGEGYSPKLHVVDTSIAGGTWEPPEYVLRDALDYTTMARLVYDLVVDGEDVSALAAGLGFRPRDIALAYETYERHLLGPSGRKCERCGRSYDRAFGEERRCRRC